MNWDTQREMPAVHGQDLRQHLTASKGSPYAFEHGHPIGHEVHPSHFSDDYGLPAANESDMEKMHEAQHASGSYHSHYHLPEDEDKPYFIGGSTIRQDRIADRIEE
jgi:hypothetical protein